MKGWTTARQSLLLRHRKLAISCAVLISLSACQMPVSQVPQAGFEKRMRDLATRYIHDKEAGMAGIVADIQNCYALASPPSIKSNAVRDCLILDTVAFYEDNLFDQVFEMMSLPYFEPNTRTARWGYYGPLARFDNFSRQVHYMAERAALVQMEMQKISSDSVTIHG